MLEESHEAEHFTASCSREGIVKRLDKHLTTMRSST